jgi:Holliday junction resolvase
VGGKASRDKGKRGEREFAAFCRDHGYDEARRTSQYCGQTGDASDCVGLPGIHIEVKRVEKLNLLDAVEQAKHDSQGDNMPIVAHRRNNCEWLITMRAEDWFKLYQAWEAESRA